MGIKINEYSDVHAVPWELPRVRLEGYSRGELNFLTSPHLKRAMSKSDIALSLAMEEGCHVQSAEVVRAMDFSDWWTQHILTGGRQTGKTWMQREMLRRLQPLSGKFVLSRIARRVKLASGICVMPQPILDTHVDKLFDVASEKYTRHMYFEWGVGSTKAEFDFEQLHTRKPKLR